MKGSKTLMKNLKKLSGILLAIAVLLACTVSAFAAPTLNTPQGSLDGGTITITNASNDQTYSAYQLLYIESYNSGAGTYTYKANPVWDTWLRSQDTILNFDGQGYVTEAASVTPAMMEKFAKDALAYAKDNEITPTDTAVAAAGEAEFTDLKLGYYLVDTTVGTLCMLSTTKPDMTAEEKNYLPTIDKKVKEDLTGNFGTANTAQIGDTVDFQITVGAKKGADSYTVHDKMEPGFTLKESSIEVTDGTTLNPGTQYTLKTTGFTDGCTFEIVFNQTYLDTITTDTDIVITYSAILNENAEIAGDTNDNTATLKYGDNEMSVAATTKTKTFKFDIVKTDSVYKLLDGAEFKLYGSASGNDPIRVKKVGDVYRVAKTDEVDDDTIIATGGKATVVGLDANTKYYLEETKQPDGYNKLNARVEVNMLEENLTTTMTGDTWALGNGGIQITNNSGAELPSTGGIGTTIFYIVGGVLVAAAVVLLVAKKRTSENR